MSVAPRRLGLLGATVLVAGTLLGSGIYLLPNTLGAYGSVTVISWAIASAGALILAGVFGLLGVLRPEADGAVAYAEEALHPALGHLGWFINWLSYWVSGPAILLAAVGYLSVFFPLLRQQAWGLGATVGLIWLFVLACIVGPRLIARIGGATLLIGLVPILLTIGIGAVAFDPAVFAGSWNVSGKSDASAMSLAVTPVLWAFVGLECANMATRVIENPRRNLPIAVVGGVAIAVVIYVAACVAIMGLLPARTLAASPAPFADAMRGVAGPLAAFILAACACAKALGTFGSVALVTGEMGRSAAAAGFLPQVLTSGIQTHRPTRDMLTTGALMTLVALASSSPSLGAQFSVLINTSVIYSVLFYLLSSVSLVVLARDLTTPWRRAAARLLAAIGAGFCAWVLATTDPGLRLPTLATIAVGLALWGAGQWRRRRALTA